MPDNPGSNGICRKLGFELMGVEEAEYPKGVFAPHNVWRLDLTDIRSAQVVRLAAFGVRARSPLSQTRLRHIHPVAV